MFMQNTTSEEHFSAAQSHTCRAMQAMHIPLILLVCSLLRRQRQAVRALGLASMCLTLQELAQLIPAGAHLWPHCAIQHRQLLQLCLLAFNMF